MDRTIVAALASLIGRAVLKTGLRDMTGIAFLREQGVRGTERAGIIRRRTFRHRVPGQPSQAHDHQYAGKNPPPARDAVQRLEVIQIDALR